MTSLPPHTPQSLSNIGDAEQHYKTLLQRVQQAFPQTEQLCIAGIHSGGVWLAKRLAADLGLTEVGIVNVAFHRDDYAKKGLHTQAGPSSLPKDWQNKTLLLVDDVMYTGRTVRAALNELFDFGRPSKVELATLADRGGRELPFAPQYCGTDVTVAPTHSLVLHQDAATGRLHWELEARTSTQSTTSTQSS